MTPEEAAAAAIDDFLMAEHPQAPRIREHGPVIAALGRIAATALENPLLREPLRANGIEPERFVAFDTPERLMADGDWDVALVISPFKGAVASLCREVASMARATGVVDTLVRTHAGVTGHNTNAYAAGATVRHLVGGVAPARVLIAGTGASARSAVAGTCRVFPGVEIGVIGRSREGATALVRDLGTGTVVDDPGAWDADTIVHATTVGETDDLVPLAFDLTPAFRPGVRVLDLTNRFSQLQASAVSAGCVTISGLLMQRLTNLMRISVLLGRAAIHP